jgi:hypothetical protein
VLRQPLLGRQQPGAASQAGPPAPLGPHPGALPDTHASRPTLPLQPIGTGLSLLGNDSIPATLEQSTQQLYRALQAFFSQHSELQARPFFITGEVRCCWCLPLDCLAVSSPLARCCFRAPRQQSCSAQPGRRLLPSLAMHYS